MMNEATLTQQWYQNRNHISRRFYLGILNQKKLKEAGFATPERITYNQAKLNGMRIKAWSNGVLIKYEDKVEIQEKVDGKIEKKVVPYIRYHTVFNIEQTELIKK